MVSGVKLAAVLTFIMVIFLTTIASEKIPCLVIAVDWGMKLCTLIL